MSWVGNRLLPCVASVVDTRHVPTSATALADQLQSHGYESEAAYVRRLDDQGLRTLLHLVENMRSD